MRDPDSPGSLERGKGLAERGRGEPVFAVKAEIGEDEDGEGVILAQLLGHCHLRQHY